MNLTKQPLCGEILRRLRHMRGVKQQVAAKNAGMSQQYYSKIELGKKITEETFNHIVATNYYTSTEIEAIKKFLKE